MGDRIGRMAPSGWHTRERGIIDPSSLSSPLGVSDGVICLVRDFYDAAVSLHGLGNAPETPAFNGSKAGRMAEGYALVLSSIGAPSLSMVLEEMIAGGVTRVLVLGIAGSITKECVIGDIVVPTWGIREEGTSHHYLPSDQEVAPSPGMLLSARSALAGLSFREGGVWSIDAPYRETRDKMDSYAAAGAVVVEMECTAAMAIAKYRGTELACILAVSDELAGESWKMGFDASELAGAISAICGRMPTIFR